MLKKIFLFSMILLLVVPALSQEKIEPIAIDVESVEKIQDIYRNVKSEINVFGTEYFPEGFGTVYIQLLDNGIPVDTGSCKIDIYFPDKTKWIDEAPLLFLENGLYYYDVVVPNLTGTHMISVFCKYTFVDFFEFADNFTVINGTNTLGQLDFTYEKGEDDTLDFEEINDTLEVDFEFNNFTIPDNATELHFLLSSRWDGKNDEIFIFLFNYNTSSFEELKNEIKWTRGRFTTTSNTITQDLENYVQNGTLVMKFKNNITNAQPTEEWFLDYLTVKMPSLADIFTNEIRGGGEIHIQDLDSISDFMAERVWETFFVMGTPPHMKSTNFYCKDNQTLVKNITFEFCKGPACTDYQKLEEEICIFGCNVDQDTCNPSPIWTLLTIIILVIALLLIVWYFSKR